MVLWNPRQGTVTRAETVNISCEGLYFLAGTRRVSGEELEATIYLPACGSNQCTVEVIWVKPTSHGEYGVGCRIRRYTVFPTRWQKTLPDELPNRSSSP
jgi:hypothetical protein